MPSTSLVAKSARPGLLTETMLVPEMNWAMPDQQGAGAQGHDERRDVHDDDEEGIDRAGENGGADSDEAGEPDVHAVHAGQHRDRGRGQMPMTEATDRSNSPTTRVIRADIARNTSTCWEPKIDEKVPCVPKVSGTWA